MSMIKILMGATLMIGAPALAQEASAGASKAAREMVQESFKKRDAALTPLKNKRDALQKQFNVLMTAEGYDEDKLAATMAEIRSVEGKIVETTGASLLSLLKALPAEDRNLFLKSLTQSGAAPVPAPRRAPAGDVGR